MHCTLDVYSSLGLQSGPDRYAPLFTLQFSAVHPECPADWTSCSTEKRRIPTGPVSSVSLAAHQCFCLTEQSGRRLSVTFHDGEIPQWQKGRMPLYIAFPAFLHLNGVSVQATSLRTKLLNGFCSFTSKVLEPPMDVQFMGRAVPYAFKFNGILWFELFFPSGTAMALCFCSKKGGGIQFPFLSSE
ncbi:hypothetical protein DPX16_4091 [Anabarilius grahami]|uniref:Uncharacterized protein n=1 Tax=Anabarilius grahami TaxID=495550 RepID=A0A3N0XYB0_ANAGA|nr:hypothetical protein DPX16_4091 [Anabarilius grahami]